jgi:hypothetical protein
VPGIAGAIAAQTATSSHAVQGELAAARANTASIPCDRIEVKVEAWTVLEKRESFSILTLGSQSLKVIAWAIATSTR